MSSPVDAHGNLIDFIPIKGDPPQSPQHISNSKRQRWGTRYLLTNDPAVVASSGGTARLAGTFIDTPVFDVPKPIDVQFRFAVNGSGNLPVLPFGTGYPLAGNSLLVTVRRGVDGTSPTFAEVFEVIAPVGVFAGSLLPFDVLNCRQLTIAAQLKNPVSSSPSASVWVEAIATPLENIATRDRVVGWQSPLTSAPSQQFVAATHGSAILLVANPTRTQFYLVNTSTDADLWVGFNRPSSGPPAPVGTIVLPKNMFASYESPIGGFRGNVFGTWVGGAPNGGALCTDGQY